MTEEICRRCGEPKTLRKSLTREPFYTCLYCD